MTLDDSQNGENADVEFQIEFNERSAIDSDSYTDLISEALAVSLHQPFSELLLIQKRQKIN